MENKVLIYRTLSVLGCCFFVTGFLFRKLDWLDVFHGIYLGPLFIASGVLLEIYQRHSKAKLLKNDTQLSSNLTYAFQFFIPMLGFLGLLILVAMILLEREMREWLFPISGFFLLLWAIILFVAFKIDEVYYNSNEVKFLKRQIVKPIDSIVEVKRFLYNLYCIKCLKGKRHYFIPHIFEVLSNPRSDPKSIKVFIRSWKKSGG